MEVSTSPWLTVRIMGAPPTLKSARMGSWENSAKASRLLNSFRQKVTATS